MKAALVRIGIDHSYGGWNAPADPESRQFVYVPIPEKAGTRFHAGCKRLFASLLPALDGLVAQKDLDVITDLGWPSELNRRAMHLDPDFETLTYGDVGNRRGSYLGSMSRHDVIVFYAGLRSIEPNTDRLIYAIVGLYTIDEVVPVSDVEPDRIDENAHTHRLKPGASDIVVRALPGCSGRLTRYLPIGDYRDRAYRIRTDLLEAWGGISANDGYIQRSAVPPRLLYPGRFLDWFHKQDVSLIQHNNPAPANPPVLVVHLRQPNLSDPNESRTDPLWEFGSFGCTGCHRDNLMNPARAEELQEARLAFVQGGPLGFKLVKLTPPVTVVHHADRIEVQWVPPTMPFRYGTAPLVIDNEGKTDFPLFRKMIQEVDRTTWVARFSSKFRSNRTPLPPDIARQVITTYERYEKEAHPTKVAKTYEQALPVKPPLVDRTRKKTYASLLSSLRSSGYRKYSIRNKCGKRKKC